MDNNQEQQPEFEVAILDIKQATHNVRHYKIQRPKDYQFIPGQATEVAINKEGFRQERRPFTFTSLPDADYLEFTIKSYTDHSGVTNELLSLKPGDSLILHDVWGAIQYKGQGSFIAGGAGITPFIAIFRDLYKKGNIGDNRLYFSNKTADDIILKEEFEHMLGDRFINTLTEDKTSGYLHERIDKEFIQKHISDMNQQFYICGPDPMVAAIKQDLEELGAGKGLITVEV